MSEPELQSACSFCEDLGSRGKERTGVWLSHQPCLSSHRQGRPKLRDQDVGPEAPLSAIRGPWHRLYLGVGWHHELGGQADVGHPAFRGEGHWIGQGVLHLDRGGRALPDQAHHLDGFEDAWRGHPETHHVV